MLLNQIAGVIIIGNSLRCVSAIILDYLLIHALKFLGGRVKSLIIDLYLLTSRRLFSALLIYNVIRSDIYYFYTFFLGLQQDYK